MDLKLCHILSIPSNTTFYRIKFSSIKKEISISLFVYFRIEINDPKIKPLNRCKLQNKETKNAPFESIYIPSLSMTMTIHRSPLHHWQLLLPLQQNNFTFIYDFSYFRFFIGLPVVSPSYFPFKFASVASIPAQAPNSMWPLSSTAIENFVSKILYFMGHIHKGRVRTVRNSVLPLHVGNRLVM